MLKESTLVVLSGGQDSITCLGLAIKTYEKVYAISFNYGQTHSIELECAAKVCKKHNIEHTIIDISFLSKMVTSGLTSDLDVNTPHPRLTNLPASFVPSRNALFLTIAHGLAQELEISNIITGVCQTDYSGYPDCRVTFINALELALNLGYQSEITIETPLMYLTKAETFALAQKVDFLETVLNDSHTCYNGDHTTLNGWGYGCGECAACKLRKAGWEEYTSEDTKKQGAPDA